MKLLGFATALCLLGAALAAKGSNVRAFMKICARGPEAKKQQIRDLAAQARSNVIALNDNTFPYYAVQKPRPYSLVVFMTGARCSICRDVDREFNLLADSYAKRQRSEDETDVFFVRLDYESNPSVFQRYGVMSVPLIFHIAPYRGEKDENDFVIEPRERFQLRALADAEALATFVRDRTGIHIPIKRSMFMAYVSVLVMFGLLALVVKPIIDNINFWLGLIRKKNLWIFVSLALYTCAISGMIYDIIRNPSMYQMQPHTGKIIWFYPQSGSQFVVEGFVIGFLNVGCAVALVVLALFVPNMKQKPTESSGSSPRTLAFFACIGVFTFCFWSVKELYRMKSRWYRL